MLDFYIINIELPLIPYPGAGTGSVSFASSHAANRSEVPFLLGPHSQGGWACDVYGDLQWFRFTGPAGTNIIIMIFTKSELFTGCNGKPRRLSLCVAIQVFSRYIGRWYTMAGVNAKPSTV